ncbi:MAG: class I SAM-dependent methyltransferase [Acidobacteria bacterium]|nr:class I SAM-dependent methyltransferase [Acidobacteriota bacterium]
MQHELEPETAATRRRYDRASTYYDWQVWPMELLGMKRFRRVVLARVTGPRVLEVGVGTGINLPDYPAGLDVDAIDLSPGMLARARRRGGIQARVHLHEMDVQTLAFSDGSFNTVVATCVFCSVPDPVIGLREIRRVLAPGGRAVLLEHVRPGGRRLGAMFDRLDPLVSRAGPHINRRTVENVRAAGFTIEVEQNLWSDILKLIVAR